jgi:antitoxin component of RelBE/YafQ-DinJ toxin-antitoxin module
MTKNKIIHTRIDEDLHKKIFEKCNELGCTFSDFIVNSLENNLENESKINNSESESQAIESRLEMKNVKISYDGKTWIDLPQKRA